MDKRTSKQNKQGADKNTIATAHDVVSNEWFTLNALGLASGREAPQLKDPEWVRDCTAEGARLWGR
jgi:hypothetical protein